MSPIYSCLLSRVADSHDIYLWLSLIWASAYITMCLYFLSMNNIFLMILHLLHDLNGLSLCSYTFLLIRLYLHTGECLTAVMIRLCWSSKLSTITGYKTSEGTIRWPCPNFHFGDALENPFYRKAFRQPIIIWHYLTSIILRTLVSPQCSKRAKYSPELTELFLSSFPSHWIICLPRSIIAFDNSLTTWPLML